MRFRSADEMLPSFKCPFQTKIKDEKNIEGNGWFKEISFLKETDKTKAVSSL